MGNPDSKTRARPGHSMLAFAGRLVTGGAHGGSVVPLDVKRLYLKRSKIIGQPTGGGEAKVAYRTD